MKTNSSDAGVRPQYDLMNIAGVILPLVFVTAFSIVGLLVQDDAFRLPYISVLCSVIFGFSLSNLIRNFDLARRFEKFTEAESEVSSDIRKKLDLIVRNSRILGTLVEENDLESVERFARWLSANRSLSSEVSEISEFCQWQRTQVLSLLSTKARECRDKEVLIDDPVKELNSNTVLLTSVPNEQVIAVSFEDTPFWLSDEGQRFLEAHKRVIDNGVSITRIFIVQGADENSLAKVMSQQVDLGITVYVVELALVQALNPQDVVIYDNILVRRGFNNAVTQDNMYKQARLIATPEIVFDELDKSRALLAMAKQWENFTSA